MKIRERGNSVQLIRSTKDEGSGKSDNEVLGSVRKPELELSDELATRLTDEERAEFDAYATRQKRSSSVINEHAVYTFGETIEKVTAWLKTADRAAVADFNEQYRKPLSKLRKQMSAANEAETETETEAA